jgi:hypothetical protein
MIVISFGNNTMLGGLLLLCSVGLIGLPIVEFFSAVVSGSAMSWQGTVMFFAGICVAFFAKYIDSREVK